MQSLPDEAFQNIVNFIQPGWYIEGESVNHELTILVSWMKHYKMFRRLKRYVELWWKKSQRNILTRKWKTQPPHPYIRRVLRNNPDDLELLVRIDIEAMWDRRSDDLHRWNMLCAIYHSDEFPNNQKWDYDR